MNFQPLKNFLDYYLPMLGIPGSDTVIYKDHEEIFRHTTGYDSIRLGTPLKSDRLYHIYSCTKISTCIAAVQLMERGEIVASDPVYAYFPEYKYLTVKVKDEMGRVIGIKPAERTMTIGHLLTMTSGLNYDLNKEGIKRVQRETDGRAPTLDICRAIAEDPLEFEPGENYNYSLSHDVLGGIIELVSGVRYNDYMRDNIFLPLGMKETSFIDTEENVHRRATKYNYDPITATAVETTWDDNPYRLGTEYDSAGAGLISSVDDYILLADALASGGVGKNGNRILSQRGVDLMRVNRLNSRILQSYGTNYDVGYGYGYGVRCNMEPAIAGNLAPVGEFGWDGAKQCFLSVEPNEHVALFHAEHMGGLSNVVFPRLRNLVYACLGY